ncbi:MAG: dihydrodipicolinate reductase [Pyrinomonadaceae bacterium]|nr:dihydrodipicolinate reductase [Pyrinomonadaceae bacterium]
MRIALFGGGAMGKLVSDRATDEGHEVACVLTSRDAGRSADEMQGLLQGLDAAIDFSVADAVLFNATACARASVPLIEGTTGWNSREAEVRQVVEEHGGTFIYGANFSVGVNLFYRIVTRAAELFQGLEDYDAFIAEAHHSRKRDAPSGTALRLRDLLGPTAREVPIASTRAGHIPGTHQVGFDSAADQITLTHTARSREGFADGALLAARWATGQQGVYEFSEVFYEILKGRV